MSSVTPTGVMDLWPERSCPSCNTNVLRRGERHEQCFDCLGHGPITMEDLRCDICRAWRPTHFLGATAKYVEGSQARLDAVKLAECEKTPQRLAPEVSLPPTCPPASIAPAVTLPLGVTQETLTSSILSVLAGLGFPAPVQGPQVPGLCSLVGQGVPVGSVPPLSAPQSVEGPPAPKKRRVSKKTLSSGRAKKDGSVPRLQCRCLRKLKSRDVLALLVLSPPGRGKVKRRLRLSCLTPMVMTIRRYSTVVHVPSPRPLWQAAILARCKIDRVPARKQTAPSDRRESRESATLQWGAGSPIVLSIENLPRLI